MTILTQHHIKRAKKLVNRYNEPCVVWLDENDGLNFSRLSWYESQDGEAFTDEAGVLSVIE